MRYSLFDGNIVAGNFEGEELLRRRGFGPDTFVKPLDVSEDEHWRPASDFPEFAAVFTAESDRREPSAA
jgi:hypothetical protein